MSRSPWKTLSSKIVYKNPWIKVREDQVITPGKKEGIYGVVSVHAPAVFIVPVEDDDTFLVKVFRYTTDDFSWELPSGGSEGQDLLVAAERELHEETGLKAKELKIVGKFFSITGISDALCYTIVAKGLSQTKNNKQKEEGITQVKKVPIKKVFEMIKNGEMTDGESITALTQAAIHLGLIQ